MILKFLQRNGSGKNQAQEQFPKVKTFSRAHEFSAAGAKAVAEQAAPAQVSSPAVTSQPDTPTPAAPGKIKAFPAFRVPDSVGMQDTQWTNSQFLIHFMNDDGSLLHTCEVPAGTTPVYYGEIPEKSADPNHVYTFTGWSPEIGPANGDTTYTAVYSIEDRHESDTVRETEEVAPLSSVIAEEAAVPEPARDFHADFISAQADNTAPEAAAVPVEPETAGYTHGEPEESEKLQEFDKTDDLPETEDAEEDNGPEEVFVTEDSVGIDEAPAFSAEPAASEPAAGAEPEWDFLSAYRSEMTDDLRPEPESVAASAGNLFPVLKSAGKTSLKASWQPMAYADGYDVFFAQCGTDFDEAYCTLSPEESSVTFDHLAKKSIYKLRVMPFTMADGHKSYIGKSFVLRGITGGSTGKYTDTRKIRIRKGHLDLVEGDKKRIRASLVGQNPDKKVLTHGKKMRFLSDDPAVASVSKKGKVKGVGTGDCHITLVAPNGVYRSLPVSVHHEVPDLSFRKKQYSITVGEKINLRKKLKELPEENVPLKWKSSEREIAYVNEKGIVTGLKEGNSTVRVRASGGAQAKVKMRVDRDDDLDLYPWESISITKQPKK